MKYIKSTVTLMLCFTLFCTCLLLSSSAEESIWAGDLDDDSKVTAADSLLLLKYMLFPTDLTPEQLAVYDINEDGYITAEDAFFILHTAADNMPLRAIDTPFEQPILPPAYRDGWNTIGSDKYYYIDGTSLTGWQDIGNFRYKFGESGVLISKVGIDVSVWQGDINWPAVKAAGVEFAMIRVGYRGYGTAGLLNEDAKFQQNIINAKNAGIKVGVYFYSQAITSAEAIEEANFVLARINGITLDYPVAYDIEKAATAPGETGRTEEANITKAQRTDFAIAFCKTIKAAGYKTQVYSNKDWFENYLDLSRLTAYDIWLAHYAASTSFASPYAMWQYSSSGSVNGIIGNVGLNVCLKDYD